VTFAKPPHASHFKSSVKPVLSATFISAIEPSVADQKR
jgi:hypothetical protein